MADFVATNVLYMPIVIAARFRIHAPQLSGHELPAALLQVIETTPLLHIANVGSGLASCALGGYVAARIAKGHEVLNGALSAWLGVTLTVYNLVARSGPIHVASNLVLIAAGVACAALGGLLGLRTRTRAV